MQEQNCANKAKSHLDIEQGKHYQSLINTIKSLKTYDMMMKLETLERYTIMHV